MMSSIRKFMCALFGHKMPRRGWFGDGLYGEVFGGERDGTGRSHFCVRHECPRCGKNWTVARFHGSQVSERNQP